jgi:hypothetical protein
MQWLSTKVQCLLLMLMFTLIYGVFTEFARFYIAEEMHRYNELWVTMLITIIWLLLVISFLISSISFLQKYHCSTFYQVYMILVIGITSYAAYSLLV